MMCVMVDDLQADGASRSMEILEGRAEASTARLHVSGHWLYLALEAYLPSTAITGTEDLIRRHCRNLSQLYHRVAIVFTVCRVPEQLAIAKKPKANATLFGGPLTSKRASRKAAISIFLEPCLLSLYPNPESGYSPAQLSPLPTLDIHRARRRRTTTQWA